jgi:uncharacterized repeat protein (TIGR03803 family)
MKMCIKKLFLLAALIVSLGLILTNQAMAQITFTNLHSFSGGDGTFPIGGLVLSGNKLYGTTKDGGTLFGTVFSVNTNGGFANLYNLNPNNDGSEPLGALILSGGMLYGTASRGGSQAEGTVFGVSTNGLNFTNLYTFIGGNDGSSPSAGLVLSGNTLYGTTQSGGTNGDGTLFAITTNGTGYTSLHSFTGTSDGSFPLAGLIFSNNTLYGTASQGGSTGRGTVFAFNLNSSVFSNLYSFSVLTNVAPFGNRDGANPEGALLLSSNTLYGTAFRGGTGGNGSVFAIHIDGTGFTNLYSFTVSDPSAGTNSDGAGPEDALILSGNTLYGTAFRGGPANVGTVFAIHTDGSGFTNLYNFTGGSDGANPYAGLLLSSNTLYGTAQSGGNGGNGTVFSLSLGSVSLPQLTIIRSGTNVVLTWPTNATGFTLQSTTNLVSAIWSNISGQFAVTNPITGAQKFYRLTQ